VLIVCYNKIGGILMAKRKVFDIFKVKKRVERNVIGPLIAQEKRTGRPAVETPPIKRQPRKL